MLRKNTQFEKIVLSYKNDTELSKNTMLRKQYSVRKNNIKLQK